MKILIEEPISDFAASVIKLINDHLCTGEVSNLVDALSSISSSLLALWGIAGISEATAKEAANLLVKMFLQLQKEVEKDDTQI